MMNTWRQLARRVIEPLELEYRHKPLEEFARALREAYPFGERRYHPYKVWCEEQRYAIERHPAWRRSHGWVDPGNQLEFGHEC